MPATVLKNARGSLLSSFVLVALSYGQVNSTPDAVFEFAGADPLRTTDYGWRIAIEGDSIFIAASILAGPSDSGIVQEWKRMAPGYRVIDTITPDVCIGADVTNCLFGRDLVVDGELMVAGSIGGEPTDPASRGLIFVLKRDHAGWVRTDLIRGRRNTVATPTGFGQVLALDSSTLAVGASGYRSGPSASSVRGAVHMYELDAAGIAHYAETLLPPPTTVDANAFGFNLALKRDTLVVGQPAQAGVAHVFHRDGSGAWLPTQTIARPIGSSTQVDFGSRVALSDDLEFLFIGDVDFVIGETPGRVFVYRRNPSTGQYGHVQTFEGLNHGQCGGCSNFFGSSIDTSGDLVAVGSYEQSVPGQGVAVTGACQVYRRRGDEWVFLDRLVGPPSPSGGLRGLGRDVAVSNGRVVVSDIIWSVVVGIPIGRAYLWEFPSATSICSGSDPSIEMSISRVDDAEGELDIAVSGLEGESIAIFAAGLPTHPPGTVTGLGTLCLDQAYRITTPQHVVDGQARLLIGGVDAARGATAGLAIQMISIDRSSPGQVNFGPAQVLFE